MSHLVRLQRTVRFCINPRGLRGEGSSANTFAGAPSMRGLGRFYEVQVTCIGRVDSASGYFLNIKVIDQAVRRVVVPRIEAACDTDDQRDPALVLSAVMPELNAALEGCVERVMWRLTPYYGIEMSSASTSSVLIRQQFDLAAAHRLHRPELSDEQNRALFGKCNNPSGHGHNYRVEPCVEAPVSAGGAAFGLADLERLTARTIIDRFDHTHLNLDTPEFAAIGGLNPSVENIAKVFFEVLAPAIELEGRGARLRCITVWETDKTSCTYPAS